MTRKPCSWLNALAHLHDPGARVYPCLTFTAAAAAYLAIVAETLQSSTTTDCHTSTAQQRPATQHAGIHAHTHARTQATRKSPFEAMLGARSFSLVSCLCQMLPALKQRPGTMPVSCCCSCSCCSPLCIPSCPCPHGLSGSHSSCPPYRSPCTCTETQHPDTSSGSRGPGAM
jgi:hypothetical protein